MQTSEEDEVLNVDETKPAVAAAPTKPHTNNIPKQWIAHETHEAIHDAIGSAPNKTGQLCDRELPS